jgi:hypothetical protein
MERIFNERVAMVAEFRDFPIRINYLPWAMVLMGLLIFIFIGVGMLVLLFVINNRSQSGQISR